MYVYSYTQVWSDGKGTLCIHVFHISWVLSIKWSFTVTVYAHNYFGACLCTCTVCTIVWLCMPVSSVLIHTCMWLLSNLQQALVHYVLCMCHYTHMGIYVYTFSHVGPQQVSHSEAPIYFGVMKTYMYMYIHGNTVYSTLAYIRRKKGNPHKQNKLWTCMYLYTNNWAKNTLGDTRMLSLENIYTECVFPCTCTCTCTCRYSMQPLAVTVTIGYTLMEDRSDAWKVYSQLWCLHVYNVG